MNIESQGDDVRAKYVICNYPKISMRKAATLSE